MSDVEHAVEHSEVLTSQQYIQHHLTNLTYGQFPDGHWGFAANGTEAKSMGFWALNVDTMGWSVLLATVFFLIFRSVAKKVTSDVHRSVRSRQGIDPRHKLGRARCHQSHIGPGDKIVMPGFPV